jgi:2,3-bisphosphoglycerate-independent phosphoglycerate mutase
MAEAIRRAYERGQEDETLLPLHLVDATGQPVGLMDDGDSVIFYNIRGEREVELSLALTQPGFAQFPARDGMTVRMATMIEYDPRITEHVAFPPEGDLPDTLSEVVSRAGLRHAKVVESEKAVHLTYFLNGRRKAPFPGEERVVIESNREVNDFDELPEMDVAAVAAATMARLADPDCALIVANFANMDVVGHIEDKAAVLAAIQAVDAAVGQVVRAAQANGVTALVTADHGSVERWYYPEGAINTGHTASPVPCLVAREGVVLRPQGDLTDVAPTVLSLMGLPVPDVMTGRSLLETAPQETGRVLLLIVDGWGLHHDPALDLVAQAETPNLDWLRAAYPMAVLRASGEVVGMPVGSVGNSECGHLHIGAGRRVLSDRMRITHAIESGAYHENPAFNWAIDEVLRTGQKLHLLGIISFYSSHGSLKYLRELLKLCAQRGVPEVYVHGMLGRRGERPESGAVYVGEIEELCRELGTGRVVSVIGRHWALDREEHWERVERAYRMLTFGEGEPVPEV